MEKMPQEFKLKMADWILKYTDAGSYEGHKTVAELAWQYMQEQVRSRESYNA